MTSLIVSRNMPMAEQLALFGLFFVMVCLGILVLVFAYKVWKGDL